MDSLVILYVLSILNIILTIIELFQSERLNALIHAGEPKLDV